MTRTTVNENSQVHQRLEELQQMLRRSTKEMHLARVRMGRTLMRIRELSEMEYAREATRLSREGFDVQELLNDAAASDAVVAAVNEAMEGCYSGENCGSQAM